MIKGEGKTGKRTDMCIYDICLPENDQLLLRMQKDQQQLLRAPSVGNSSTQVDEGRNSSCLLAIKMEGTNRSGDGGEKSLRCDPGSELRLGGREKKKGEYNKWDGKIRKKKVRAKNFHHTTRAQYVAIHHAAAHSHVCRLDASRRGKEMLNSSRDKIQGTHRSRGGEGRGVLICCSP